MTSKMNKAMQDTPQPTMSGTEGKLDGPISYVGANKRNIVCPYK